MEESEFRTAFKKNSKRFLKISDSLILKMSRLHGMQLTQLIKSGKILYMTGRKDET